MKVKEGFVLRNVATSWVIVAVGKASTIFKGVIELNETSKFLFSKMLEGKFSKDSLTNALLDEYEVNKNEAERDVSEFIDRLKGIGVIE